MGFYSAFNVTVKKRVTAAAAANDEAVAEAVAAAEGESEEAVGVFVTAQSLVSFTGATAVINTIWGTIGMFAQLEGAVRNLTGLIISLVVGASIYLINVTDPQANMTRRDRTIAAGIALINSLLLFIASFGVQAAAVTGTK
jgi:hypothetical protein